MTDFKQRFRALVAKPGERTPIRAAAPIPRGDETSVVLRIYDPIDDWGGQWGISAKEFVQVLDELPDTVTEITLHINSPGGIVFEAVAILNALRKHKAKVIAYVDGLAASAASFIACGADELVMGRNSELMIHSPWVMCIGDAADMREQADLLDKLEANIAAIYRDKAGGDVADWVAAMHAETWYSAEEAMEAGLADRVDGAETGTADSPKDRFDLSIFNFAGRRNAPDPQLPVAGPGGGHRNPKGGPAVAFSDEQLQHMRQRLGLEDSADEAAILAALDQTLDEFVDPENQPEPTPVPAAQLPAGVVAIDEAQLAELRNHAAAGRDARDEQQKQHRQQLVAAAVKDGRIPPARAEHWITQLEADPGAEQVLAGLEKGLVPVDELGTSAVDLESDAALYKQLFGEEVTA